jgi:hypothetical protein
MNQSLDARYLVIGFGYISSFYLVACFLSHWPQHILLVIHIVRLVQHPATLHFYVMTIPLDLL